MIAGWVAVLTALVYLCALFAIAHYADTSGRGRMTGRWRPLIYALTLCTYCTSWTFFGSVGIASSHGYDFLPIYVGAVLAGLISHAPGGLGVFESIMLASFTQAQRPDLLAAMLCYRLTYSLLPFVLGSLALAAFEARQRWGGRSNRGASTQFDGG